MLPHGNLLIGQEIVATERRFTAVDAASGANLPVAFAQAGPAEVEKACSLAWSAFDVYRSTSPAQRAAFLERIADNILALGDGLLERAQAETGLPLARLTGERARTMGQLRLFATLLREGGGQETRIDPALPDRQPLPRPDLRMRQVPLGPVAVFGASNFPLAFSTAGGDSAAALAAGCPVVVKGHPAHPGTAELVGGAIAAAVQELGLPAGTFSLLQGTSHELGAALVADHRIKAVGFTGSRAGGLALLRIANARPEPIPVYAEMSSINPVILLPGALAARGAALASGFATSLTQGAGQFCTNPGLLLAVDGPELDGFVATACDALAGIAPQTMLTAGIADAYRQGVVRLTDHADVTRLVGDALQPARQASPALFSTSAAAFQAAPDLAMEIFGPVALLVRCPDMESLSAVLEGLEGQLTATLQLEPADMPLAQGLRPVLERKAGRILCNGWPTGVEVCHAMVHGGPFPATSDGRSTSVGTLAITRFQRPVCYQDLPAALLPPELRQS